MANVKTLILVFTFHFHVSYCDIYFHNPRGSNNRLDEAKRERQNDNRLFDSQNNQRGGYNVGNLYYYQGSTLNIEWTNQHSCSNENSHCDIVIQYMCSNQLRDGATVRTIPVLPDKCVEQNCSKDFTYGMHEDLEHYLQCITRERNLGLFTADQLNNVKGSATKTRQNPKGTRYGYECPEERDYYPYWHPSPWVDIAVLTNNATRCPYYQTNSQNGKSRWYCKVPHSVLVNRVTRRKLIPNNMKDCEAFTWSMGEESGKGEWVEEPSRGLPPPECRETQLTRDNHLGNGFGGQPVMYNWTIPNIEHENCALRIRYNISTNDYQVSDEDISKTHRLDQSEALKRGYRLKNNPVVKIFPGVDLDLRLAINTAQYGRTFQDRSHRFAIRKRPADLSDVRIHNVNVRGKRGNIVQVYPAVEYDFVPAVLHAGHNDYVHFQWTGSNTNPNNNDGQGLAGTDRSNVVLLADKAYHEGQYRGDRYGQWGRSYPSNTTSFLGLDREDTQRLAFNRDNQFGGELSELNDAGTYFDLGPRKMTQRGDFYYFCTRNNNFSNRSQKGKIVCGSEQVSASIGWNGGTVTMGPMRVEVPQATFSSLQTMNMVVWSKHQTQTHAESLGRTINMGDGLAGDVLVIHPETDLTDVDKSFTVDMPVGEPAALSMVNIYRTTTQNFVTWTRVDAHIQGGVARFQTSRGGVYAPFQEKDMPLIVGVVMAVILLIALVVGTVLYFRRHPGQFLRLKQSVTNAKLSTQNRI